MVVRGPALPRVFSEGAVILPACTDHELPDPFHRIGQSIRVLGREALVIVVVAVQNDVRAGCIEVLPERVVLRVVSVLSRAETRLVPVRKCATIAVRSEIIFEPL